MARTTLKVRIGEQEREFVLLLTNAPKEYDHGAAIEVHDGSSIDRATGRPVIERYVLVHAKDVEWQKGRNGSGLYRTEDEDIGIDSDYLTGWALGRIYGGDVTLSVTR